MRHVAWVLHLNDSSSCAEGYGVTTDGHTTFYNASTCTLQYRPINNPIVFDLPIPPKA